MPILSLIIWAPLVGALIVLMLPKENTRAIQIVSFIAALSTPGAWFGVVFFGAGAVVLAMSALPAYSSLRLTPTGFTVRSPFRRREVPWSEVEEFAVGRQPGRGAAVTVTYRAGEQRLLPDNFGMAAVIDNGDRYDRLAGGGHTPADRDPQVAAVAASDAQSHC